MRAPPSGLPTPLNWVFCSLTLYRGMALHGGGGEKYIRNFSSVQSLSRVRLFVTPWPQHARPPCPSPTPGVHSDSRPLSQWCHPAISSCVIPFSSCPQSLPASESFPVSQLFAWGGQSTGVSTSRLIKRQRKWAESVGKSLHCGFCGKVWARQGDKV